MLRGIRAKLSGFRAGTRGVVLYLVAMLMVPFVVLIGVAVDMGQLLVMKNQLAAAVDAAALGAAGLPLDQAQTQAQAFVSANFSSQNPSATLTNFALTQVTLPDSRCPQANAAAGTPAVYVTDELTMNTAFLQVIRLTIRFRQLSPAASPSPISKLCSYWTTPNSMQPEVWGHERDRWGEASRHGPRRYPIARLPATGL